MSDRVEMLYPAMRKDVYAFLGEAQELEAYIFCGYRSYCEQSQLYAQGRTMPGEIVTRARPGYSYHNFGLALDVVFRDKNGNWTWNSPHWDKLGEIGKKHGFHWGGDWAEFPDQPHFERNYGQTLEALRRVYAVNGDTFDVWAYIDELWENKDDISA